MVVACGGQVGDTDYTAEKLPYYRLVCYYEVEKLEENLYKKNLKPT